MHRLSLVAEGTRGYSVVVAHGFSLHWHLGECELSTRWCVGLVAPQHVESSWTRDQTHFLCIARWIPNHWTTKEVHKKVLNSKIHCWRHLCSSRCLTVSCITIQNISFGVKKKKKESVEKNVPLLGISGRTQMRPVDRGPG